MSEPIAVYIGSDWEFEYTITDQDGAAVDVTTSTNKALLKAKATDADADALAELTVDVSAGSAGLVRLSLGKSATAALTDRTTYVVGHRMVLNDWDDQVQQFYVTARQAIVRAIGS